MRNRVLKKLGFRGTARNRVLKKLGFYNGSDPFSGLKKVRSIDEIRRINTPSHPMIDTLNQEIGLKICDLPFSQIIQSAIQQTWIRDPFDRIIVGQAAVNQCPLVTKDLLIHTHYAHAIWD